MDKKLISDLKYLWGVGRVLDVEYAALGRVIRVTLTAESFSSGCAHEEDLFVIEFSGVEGFEIFDFSGCFWKGAEYQHKHSKAGYRAVLPFDTHGWSETDPSWWEISFKKVEWRTVVSAHEFESLFGRPSVPFLPVRDWPERPAIVYHLEDHDAVDEEQAPGQRLSEQSLNELISGAMIADIEVLDFDGTVRLLVVTWSDFGPYRGSPTPLVLEFKRFHSLKVVADANYEPVDVGARSPRWTLDGARVSKQTNVTITPDGCGPTLEIACEWVEASYPDPATLDRSWPGWRDSDMFLRPGVEEWLRDKR